MPAKKPRSAAQQAALRKAQAASAAKRRGRGKSSGSTSKPKALSKKLAPGIYSTTGPDGVKYRIEQIFTETPGYGKESNWWISRSDGSKAYFDPAPTKYMALEAIHGRRARK